MLRGCRGLLNSYTHLTVEEERLTTGSSTFALLIHDWSAPRTQSTVQKKITSKKENREKRNDTLRRGGNFGGKQKEEKPNFTELNSKKEQNSLMKLLACPCHMRFIIGVMHRVITVVWRRCAPGGVSLVGSPLWVSTSSGTPPWSGGVLPRIPGTPR